MPEDLYRALSDRARERDTSVTAETIRLLRRALSLDRPGQAAILEAIRQDRRRLLAGAPSAAQLIRQDRGR